MNYVRDEYMPNSSYYNVRNYMTEFRRIKSGSTFELYQTPNQRMFEAAQQAGYLIIEQPAKRNGYVRFMLLKKRDAKKYSEKHDLEEEEKAKSNPIHFDIKDLRVEKRKAA